MTEGSPWALHSSHRNRRAAATAYCVSSSTAIDKTYALSHTNQQENNKSKNDEDDDGTYVLVVDERQLSGLQSAARIHRDTLKRHISTQTNKQRKQRRETDITTTTTNQSNRRSNKSSSHPLQQKVFHSPCSYQ